MRKLFPLPLILAVLVIQGCDAPAKAPPPQKAEAPTAVDGKKEASAPAPVADAPVPEKLKTLSAKEKAAINKALKNAYASTPFEVVKMERVSEAENMPNMAAEIRLEQPAHGRFGYGNLLARGPKGDLSIAHRIRLVDGISYDEKAITDEVALKIADALKTPKSPLEKGAVELLVRDQKMKDPPLPPQVTHLIVHGEKIENSRLVQRLIPLVVSDSGVSRLDEIKKEIVLSSQP